MSAPEEVPAEEIAPNDPERASRPTGLRGLMGDRPRLIVLLIGATALGGIVCMCLAVAALAYWQR